ncbi:hypothetical protein [Bacillus aquiflavi]|uniref:hypothetical protein n=1 Tax=Bacillus aquiflavi TaxID=2672567 RepID=UPI00223C4495|nr:hypothetical protein [Bacillus aquiflavi]
MELLEEILSNENDIDLERFFDTVHHDKLMRIISYTIKDGDVISLILIRKYLTSGVMVNGKRENTPHWNTARW